MHILKHHVLRSVRPFKQAVRPNLKNSHKNIIPPPRFSEGFYTTENSARSALTSKDYSGIVEILKKSLTVYPLPLECRELDGDHNTLPILFEDVFQSNPVQSHSVCECLRVKLYSFFIFVRFQCFGI